VTDAERFQGEYRLFLGAERQEERLLRPLIDAMPGVKVRPPPAALGQAGFVAGAWVQSVQPASLLVDDLRSTGARETPQP